MAKAPSVSSKRLRFGLALWIFSYLPFPLVLSGMLHWAGVLASDKSTAGFIAIMWGIQIIVGFVGLYFAGSEAIAAVRAQGIKKLPKNLWNVLLGRTG